MVLAVTGYGSSFLSCSWVAAAMVSTSAAAAAVAATTTTAAATTVVAIIAAADALTNNDHKEPVLPALFCALGGGRDFLPPQLQTIGWKYGADVL